MTGKAEVKPLPLLIQALLKPEIYPEHPNKVELVQTQISFVFLVGDYVYKIKKPVDFGFLDYTTLEKRRFYCQQEVALNARLCPQVYLGVVPIIQKEGQFFLGELGEAVEYAVKMRRLPEHRLMNVLLDKGQVTPQMVARVAERLADFHQQAQTSPEIAAFGQLHFYRLNNQENFDQTEKYIGLVVSKEDFTVIKEYALTFIDRHKPLFEKRRREGKIRDCHGDVHSAHVCFTDGLCIFDCIEFNERFRYTDVGNEVAFLAMDLDYHGRRDLAQALGRSYIEITQDEDLWQLWNFFRCYRACVRAKVESFKLDDPHISEEEKKKSQAAAQKYFALAKSYTSRPGR